MTSLFENARADFPALAQNVHNKPLVYLDTAASALKPRPVMETMSAFALRDYANIHRGAHELSQRSTAAYEAAREKVQNLLGAERKEEIVFTRNATEAVNLIAQTFGRTRLNEGDEVLITGFEHHANIVPWQLLGKERGIKLVVAPITPEGEVPLERIAERITPRTKLIAIAHISNALGTVMPVRAVADLAHEHGIPLLVDGAQAVSHQKVNVRDLGADFYVFSGHKLYGPTGIGALYAKWDLLKDLPPWQGGGDMILSVTFEETLFAEAPQRFEAGTPAIIEAIGLAAAIDYVSSFGFDAIGAHEEKLRLQTEEGLRAIPGVKIIGTAKEKAGLVSFVMDGVHPHDIGTILDQSGVAIRTGHHCAQPVMEALGIPATARASFGLYNNEADVDAFLKAVLRVKEIFG